LLIEGTSHHHAHLKRSESRSGCGGNFFQHTASTANSVCFAIDLLAVSLKGDLDLLLVFSSHIPDADLGRQVFRHLYESLSLQRVRMGEDHWPSSVGLYS